MCAADVGVGWQEIGCWWWWLVVHGREESNFPHELAVHVAAEEAREVWCDVSMMMIKGNWGGHILSRRVNALSDATIQIPVQYHQVISTLQHAQVNGQFAVTSYTSPSRYVHINVQRNWVKSRWEAIWQILAKHFWNHLPPRYLPPVPQLLITNKEK